MTVPEPPDDLDILNEDTLFRRIYHAGAQHAVKFVVEDPVRHDRRPTSASFDPDEDGLSLYLEKTLHEWGLGPEAIITEPMNAVASIRTQVFRDNGLGIVHDAWPLDVPEPAHPRHAAHCLAKAWERCKSRKEEQRLRKALALAANLVVDPGAA